MFFFIPGITSSVLVVILGVHFYYPLLPIELRVTGVEVSI